MSSKSIRTVAPSKGFVAIGPYSVGKIFNGTAYISGQLGINPQTNELVSDSIQQQTEQILKNLTVILKSAGSSLQNVLKCTVYLLTMDDFAKVNAVYAKYFKVEQPARVCVAVSQLPKGGKVEIDAIAVVDEEAEKETEKVEKKE